MARSPSPPRHRWIEYHALWQGWLISGRCRLDEQGDGSYWEPGAHAYLIHRMQDVEEAVWRFATKEVEGRVVRPFPAL